MKTLEMNCENLDSGIRKVSLIGRLDIPGVQDLELKFTANTSSQRIPVIVDLTEVSLITSIGVGMLIANAKTLRSHGIPFIILNPRPNVEKVLLMSGLQEILPIERSLEAALHRIVSNNQ